MLGKFNYSNVKMFTSFRTFWPRYNYFCNFYTFQNIYFVQIFFFLKYIEVSSILSKSFSDPQSDSVFSFRSLLCIPEAVQVISGLICILVLAPFLSACPVCRRSNSAPDPSAHTHLSLILLQSVQQVVQLVYGAAIPPSHSQQRQPLPVPTVWQTFQDPRWPRGPPEDPHRRTPFPLPPLL